MKLPIYMDCHATTPVDPRVFEAMTPFFLEQFGNAASSSHPYGWQASRAVEGARKQVAALLRAGADEIVFTSGCTESDNLAIKGAARAARARGNHVITCVTEHKAVLDACSRLEREGFRITRLPVDSTGRLSAEAVRDAMSAETILVTLMAATNGIGVLHPIAEVGALCRERDVVFHVDAAQAIGRIPFDVVALQTDVAAFTAHKFYGPKGAGALYVRRGVKVEPILEGGGHERGMRSGTLNVPGIVGLGHACELVRLGLAEESTRILHLRKRLQEGIQSRLDGVHLNGHPTERVAGNLNLSFEGVEGQPLMMGLKDLAVSSGSACNSACAAPSHVLKAIGLSDELADTSLRFGLGRFTTAEEVDYAIECVSETVTKLREVTVCRSN